MPHFLDEQGNIPKQMPNEARVLASFFAFVIDTTTNINPKRLSATNIKCFEKECQETTRVEILHPNDEIHWMCSRCQNEEK